MLKRFGRFTVAGHFRTACLAVYFNHTPYRTTGVGVTPLTWRLGKDRAPFTRAFALGPLVFVRVRVG